jgi:Major Facilitator Superfamily.
MKSNKLTYRHTFITCYFGYITQAIAVNLLPLFFIIFQTDFGISFEKLGRLIFIFFVTQIIVDLIIVKYVDRIGYRIACVLAHCFSTVGIASLSILPLIMPPYTGLVISVIIYAVGSGTIEVIISPIIDAIPSEAKASNMSLLHSFYCWGQLLTVVVTTVLLKIIGGGLWFILPALWALIPFYNIFRFIRTPLVPPMPEEKRMTAKDLLKNKMFIVSLVLMTCAGAAELAMAQWASLFAETSLNIPKMAGDILGPGMFALCMAIGRTIYGVWGHKFNLTKVMSGCSVLCIACYLLTALSPLPVFAIIGCSLCGFSVCLMWPGVLSLSSEKFPYGGTAMFGICAIFGDLGCSIGPWLTGVVADSVPETWGLKAGLLTSIIFPVVMIIGIMLLNKSKDSKVES